MHVVDHAPQAWFLLGSGAELYLDVNCNHGAIGYSVLIRLDQDERTRLTHEGRAYLDVLSRAVHDSVPIADDDSPYAARNQSHALGSEVMEAIRAWRHPAPP